MILGRLTLWLVSEIGATKPHFYLIFPTKQAERNLYIASLQVSLFVGIAFPRLSPEGNRQDMKAGNGAQ